MKLIAITMMISAAVLSFGTVNADEEMNSTCSSMSDCTDNESCPCWCSSCCRWRDRREGDDPVFIEEDESGKHCYCSQDDYERRGDCGAE